MSYLLRVAVPDRPGSLGSLAAALGSVGADIISLDVVERYDGVAIDDIVVDVPSATLPDTLITAAERLDGVAVESLQPFQGLLDARRELEFVDAVHNAGRDDGRTLVDLAPGVLRVGWAIIVAAQDGECRIVARGSSAPETDGALLDSVCAVDVARAVNGDEVPEAWTAMDTALAAAPLGGGRVLLLGRPGGPDYLPSELARFGFLAGILSQLASSTA